MFAFISNLFSYRGIDAEILELKLMLRKAQRTIATERAGNENARLKVQASISNAVRRGDTTQAKLFSSQVAKHLTFDLAKSKELMELQQYENQIAFLRDTSAKQGIIEALNRITQTQNKTIKLSRITNVHRQALKSRLQAKEAKEKIEEMSASLIEDDDEDEQVEVDGASILQQEIERQALEQSGAMPDAPNRSRQMVAPNPAGLSFVEREESNRNNH